MSLFIKCVFFLSLLLNGKSKPKNNKVEKTNQTIINFFINKELSYRNYEIVGVFDYIPTEAFKKEIKNIKVISSAENRYNEEIDFTYNNNNLTNISYAVDRNNNSNFIKFRYRLNYIRKNRLEKIYIKDRLIFFFEYNSKGQLKLVKHFFKDGMVKIYNTSYKEETIKFSIDVIRNGKTYLDASNKDYLIINKDKKLTSYNFSGIHSYYNIEYLKDGNIKGFSYNKTNSSKNEAGFIYTKFNDEGIWLERSVQKYKTKRIINYK